MAIQDLSVELLQHILSFCRPPDLVRVLRTCRALNIVSEPFLYESITFARDYLKRVQLLLRTLLYSPNLGAYIKNITIRGTGPSYPATLSREGLKALALRGSIVGSVTYRDWLGILGQRSCGYVSRQAFLVLLLSYCQELQSLDLEHERCYAHDEADDAARAAEFLLTLGKLDSLKRIAYVRNDDGNILSSSSPLVSCLLSPPNMEQITLSIAQDAQYDLSEVESHCVLSPAVRSLELKDSDLSELSISYLISRAENLTSLRLGLRKDAASPNSFLDCSSLGEYLTDPNDADDGQLPRQRQEMLRHLAVSIRFYSTTMGASVRYGGAFECGRNGNMDEMVGWGLKGSLGSLKDLTALESLEIPLPVLLGWYADKAVPLRAVLPDGLKHLCLRDDLSHWDVYDWDVEAVRALLEGFVERGEVGGLKSIEYRLLRADMRANGELLEGLRGGCARVGIRFVVVGVGGPSDEEG